MRSSPGGAAQGVGTRARLSGGWRGHDLGLGSGFRRREGSGGRRGGVHHGAPPDEDEAEGVRERLLLEVRPYEVGSGSEVSAD
jgi:hypothetical protein